MKCTSIRRHLKLVSADKATSGSLCPVLGYPGATGESLAKCHKDGGGTGTPLMRKG